MEYIISGLIIAAIFYAFYKKGQEMSMFKIGRNPFVRECKRCGAIHNNMSWSMNDNENAWWEEVAEGNDPACKCKQHQNNPLPGF